ncbi:MAG: cytidylyltransferase domain-containing protein, partial [Nitrospinota bacterium]
MTDQARPVVLGLIPARGGSKSVPRKNLHPLGGVPLIVHTIEVARGAKRLTRTIVSTDDEEIAQVAREAGVYVPFLRPAQFAQDESLDQEAFRHALEWLAAEEGYAVDYLVTLRPTSPLRLAEHIDEAVALALSSQADVVKTVTEASVPPHKTWRIAGDRMVPLVPSVLWDRRGPDVPRQSLEPAYWQNGLVDV